MAFTIIKHPLDPRFGNFIPLYQMVGVKSIMNLAISRHNPGEASISKIGLFQKEVDVFPLKTSINSQPLPWKDIGELPGQVELLQESSGETRKDLSTQPPSLFRAIVYVRFHRSMVLDTRRVFHYSNAASNIVKIFSEGTSF